MDVALNTEREGSHKDSKEKTQNRKPTKRTGYKQAKRGTTRNGWYFNKKITDVSLIFE